MLGAQHSGRTATCPAEKWTQAVFSADAFTEYLLLSGHVASGWVRGSFQLRIRRLCVRITPGASLRLRHLRKFLTSLRFGALALGVDVSAIQAHGPGGSGLG